MELERKQEGERPGEWPGCLVRGRGSGVEWRVPRKWGAASSRKPGIRTRLEG